ncbi:hypothetical protein EDB19DRAFT_1833443 [Suillus lakei]|nr:hypothetical protein EDB19DRAFT_1833443 [Suillus lakei]
MYKAFKAKLASCETAHQHLLTTTWELEEVEHYTAFLEAFHAESKQLLGSEDTKLEKMRAWFSSHSLTEVADDTNHLQAMMRTVWMISRTLMTDKQGSPNLFVQLYMSVQSAKARPPSQNHLEDQASIHQDYWPAISSLFLQNNYGYLIICSIHMRELGVGRGCTQFHICEDGTFDLDALYGLIDGQMLVDTQGTSAPQFHSHDEDFDLDSLYSPTDYRACKDCETYDTPGVNAINTCNIVGLLFTQNVMSQTTADWKGLVKAAVMDTVPQFSSLTVSFNSIINKVQFRSISQALTNAHGKIIDIAHSSVPHAYNLYHPRHEQERTPVEYRVHIATTLTNSQSLAFMHAHHFNASGNLHIDGHFNHAFIKHVVIQFIWYFGFEKFLGNSPLQSLRYVILTAGATTHCVLLKQRMPKPSIDPFMGLIHYNKFVEICDALDGLQGEEEVAFET